MKLNCSIENKDDIINRVLNNPVYIAGSSLRENVAEGLRRMSLSNLNGLEIILGMKGFKPLQPEKYANIAEKLQPQPMDEADRDHCHCPGRKHFVGCHRANA